MININGHYGARVGNLQVFTREGAERTYLLLAACCYADLTLESSVVLSEAALDMYRIGFTPAEVEDLELQVLEGE